MVRKHIMPFLLSICLLAGTCMVSASAAGLEDNATTVNETATKWGSDYDTATSFTITSVADLQAFANMVNEGKDFSDKTVALEADLDLSSVEKWAPIGSANLFSDDNPDEGDFPFAGIFDGENHKISNLTISYSIEEADPLYDYGGLFGYVTGTVKNVTLENVNLKAASDYMGGIAGALGTDAVIENCSVSGVISGAEYNSRAYGSYVGGIVGDSKGTISSCTSSCTIKDTLDRVGGIAGMSKGGSIQNCKNTGDIEGRSMTGGIVGDAENSTISDCSNGGTITGKENSANKNENRRVGGIVGDAQTTTIENCANTGTVIAGKLHQVGGVVGYLYYGSTVKNCSNDGVVTGGDSTGGVVGFASAYSTEGYEITNCTNSGSVTGNSGVGGVVGVSTANDNNSSTQVISGCTNSAEVAGKDDVGGIVGEHNSDELITSSGINTATVRGCINTGSVAATDTGGVAGVIVGNNNDATKSSDTSEATNPGTVENNFWPAELGDNAVGSGSESDDAVKNNSSYQPDGTLTTPVTVPGGEESETITNLGDAIEKVIGGEAGDPGSIPDVLKVTVSYNRNGHGTAPQSVTVVLGKSVTLPSINDDGYYTFTGWSDGSTTYAAGDTVTVMKDTTFTAQWRDDTPSSSGGGSSSSTTYAVSVEDSKNGSVSVSPKRAEKGDTVTITVKPDTGYELDELTVTDKDGDSIKLTEKDDNKFTFKMPGSRVEVEASFKLIETEPENPFTDISKSDYFYDAVLWAADKGITSGVTDTLFAPNTSCTRAQMVTFLWRANGSPVVDYAMNFTDVPADAYYADAVRWAVSKGITSGTSATTFAPDMTVTRSQTVTFLYRAAGTPAVSGGSFADVDANAYYADAVTWAVAEGITSGTSATTFSPDAACTRGQIVTFLYRAQ